MKTASTPGVDCTQRDRALAEGRRVSTGRGTLDEVSRPRQSEEGNFAEGLNPSGGRTPPFWSHIGI